MARNQEKANLMFNRWTTMREEVDRGGPAECVAVDAGEAVAVGCGRRA